MCAAEGEKVPSATWRAQSCRLSDLRDVGNGPLSLHTLRVNYRVTITKGMPPLDTAPRTQTAGGATVQTQRKEPLMRDLRRILQLKSLTINRLQGGATICFPPHEDLPSPGPATCILAPRYFSGHTFALAAAPFPEMFPTPDTWLDQILAVGRPHCVQPPHSILAVV